MHAQELSREVPEVPAPQAPPLAEPAALPRWRLPHRITLVSALAVVPVWMAAAWLPLGHGAVEAALAFTGIAGLELIAFVAGVVTLVRMRRAALQPSSLQRGATWFLTVVFGLWVTGLGALWALIATFGFHRGRQLRRFGRVLLPALSPGETWNALPFASGIPAELRVPLAAQWRENGRTEHASVAAFARLTLDLMALGAPPKLLQDAQRDAQDEIRHAELCFSLARGLDGRTEQPAPFPQAARARTLSRFRTLALAQLAVSSLVDGALHEGLSARVIAQLAKRCEHPEVRAVLKELAADEGRHCAHGWDVVEWCVAEGGWVVQRALAGALRTLPETLRSPLPEQASTGGWERCGIHGHALEAEQYGRARAELVRRVERLTAPSGNRLEAAA
jgi:hypothetical protein